MPSAGFNPLGGMTEAVKGFMNSIKDAIVSNFEGDKIKTVLRDMEQGATEVAKQFGQGRENIVALQASMGDAVQTVTRMGGSFQSILNIQKEINAEIGRNVILQGEAFENIYITTKVTGVEADKLAKSFKDTGFSLYDTNKEMQKVVDVARQQGVSACSDVGTTQFRLPDGTIVTNTGTIVRGYKAGYGINETYGGEASNGGRGGSGATGTFTTNGSGVINSVSLTNAGSGYITAPIISFSAGAGSNGSIIASLNSFTRNGIVNSLNFSITFTIEQDEF